MKSKRPVYISLTQYRFPVTAIASVLHRISGVLMFLTLPLFVYMLHESLSSPKRFAAMQGLIEHFGYKLWLWIGLSAVIYHLFAGIRHVIMDLGFGEGLTVSRATAYVVIILGVLATLYIGVQLW